MDVGLSTVQTVGCVLYIYCRQHTNIVSRTVLYLIYRVLHHKTDTPICKYPSVNGFSITFLDDKKHQKLLSTSPTPTFCTHQYGVPMKESLLCKVLLFFADTPKSATRMKKDKKKKKRWREIAGKKKSCPEAFPNRRDWSQFKSFHPLFFPPVAAASKAVMRSWWAETPSQNL